jgi:AAA family ATP:ADP antiporter
MGSGPFKAIVDIRRSELPLAVLMFFYFFLVITTFWILKPIKKTIFLEYYQADGFEVLGRHLSGPQAELIAKVMNMLVAFVAVVVFTWLARHLRRQQLTFVFGGFFLAAYVGYSSWIAHPDAFAVWSFYLFGDLFSTLMVATFFAFLNDSVSSDEAKRIYGLVGLGGVTGGVFGTTIVRTLIDEVSRSDWLWICFGIALVIMAVAFAAGRIVDRKPPARAGPEPAADEPKQTGNPAVEGATLVFRSSYLLAIVGIVGLYEIVSTIMDFQFTSTVVHYVEPDEIGRYLSTVYLITNCVSLIVQLFLTSFVMTRFGVGTALLVLPIAALSASTGLLALPVLLVGSMLNTADNGFSYSINQSAKEALYVPTTRDEKYKAKAFIDMFVQRFAKAVAVGLSLGITLVFDSFESIRWLSLVTLPIILLWILAVRHAGRRFAELAGEGEGERAS